MSFEWRLSKIRWIVVAALLPAVIIFSACGDSSSDVAEPEPDTTPPEVTLAASDTLVLDEGDVTLTAVATDDQGVETVEFYEGGTMIGSADSNPYELILSFTETDNGVHQYSAVALDASDNSSESDTLDLIVGINLQAGFVNGTFDTDASGWVLENNDQWSGYMADQGDPAGCVRLNEYGTCEVDPSAAQEVYGFVPGLTYTISGDYRPCVDWIGNQYALSFVITVDGEVVASMARGPNGSDWSPFSADFVATQFVHTITFYAEWGCDDSCYDVDNLELSLAAGR